MKILLVDDDHLILDGLEIILNNQTDMNVIGTVRTGRAAIDFVQNQRPDVILMDIRMPELDGILAVKAIKAMDEAIKILMLTTFKDDNYIREAISEGADGYLLKSQPAGVIVKGIRTVYAGNTVIEEDVMNTLKAMLNKSTASLASFGLTQREIEVLALIGEGMNNKEISEQLFLGEGTIRNYVTVLLDKLDLRDRTQLALFYVQHR